ncbi:target of rapamycin (TOR) kinase 1 [Trypanosoma cruzi]|nr:target of rapamycin (TOR) kinase 1 [Trypanosoma cruzi]
MDFYHYFDKTARRTKEAFGPSTRGTGHPATASQRARTEPGAEQKPVEPGHLGEAHASMGARRAARFSSSLLRQSARELAEDSGDRRAIGGGDGNGRGRFVYKKRLMDNTLFWLWRRKPPLHDCDGSRGRATRTETTLARRMFLSHTSSIVCRLRWLRPLPAWVPRRPS